MGRAEALSWWRHLLKEEKEKLVEKHFPGIDFILIDLSSSKIEIMFTSEMNGLK